MKRILALAATLTPSAALAHPGDHGGFSVLAMLTHLVSEPDHVALILACATAAGVLLYRARVRK